MLIKSQKLESYGIWEVSTEGDCEGRTTRDLGIHQGYIDEVALSLKHKVMYKLYFSPYNPKIEVQHTAEDGSVSLSISGHPANGNKADIDFARSLFRDRPVEVIECSQYQSFTIKSRPTKEMHRERALSKLTTEEREALGL